MRPAFSWAGRSMPSDFERASIVATLSSKAYMNTFSPRAAAADAHCVASADFPVPGGPSSSALVPRSRPPPSIASSSGIPLEATPRSKS